MRGEKLLLYLAILLLVVGVYFYTESRHSRQLAEEKASKQVFQVKIADIHDLTLKSDKGEINLQRVSETEKPAAPLPPEKPTSEAAGEKWRLTKPITTKADELTVTSLLSALTDLKMQRHLDDVTDDKIKEFGLDKPLFTLEFQAAGKTHQIRFGQNAPGNQNIYAKKDDESRLLLIRVADKETLDRTLTALRTKDIFSLNPEKVSEIRIIRPDDRLIFHKSTPGEWTPGSHLKIKLRNDKINSLLKQISGVKAAEFVAEKAGDLKKYGLVPSPALRLTLMGDGQEETLLLGSKQGDRYYAQVSGTAPIILVDQSLLEKIPSSYEAFEDRRLWAGPDTEVQKVVWGAPDKLMTAMRDQNGWSILNPDNSPAGQESAMKFNLIFWRLKDLEFTRLLPPDIKKEKKPLFTLQIFGTEDKLLFKMEELSENKDQAQVTFPIGEKTLTGIIPVKAFIQLKDALSGLTASVATKQEKPPAGK